MQRGVSLDRLPVHVGPDLDEVLGDPEVALVAGDHQAGVAVPVRHLDVWKWRGRVQFRGLQDLNIPSSRQEIFTLPNLRSKGEQRHKII